MFCQDCPAVIHQVADCGPSTWRPLKGPLFDWPLAVCDARTFDQDRDALVSDAVYPEWAYENILVHHHTDQKWHYFSALQESETMLFKCTDSDGTASGRKFWSLLIMNLNDSKQGSSLTTACPHAAFPISQSGSSNLPRESVESRAFVLWTPIDDFPQEVGTLYGERV